MTCRWGEYADDLPDDHSIFVAILDDKTELIILALTTDAAGYTEPVLALFEWQGGT